MPDPHLDLVRHDADGARLAEQVFAYLSRVLRVEVTQPNGGDELRIALRNADKL